ncbi:MAG: hypothetical protein UU98_C0012G0041 [Parcubacteria group bacterium GW2011_GWD2_42_14]|nr:MAG: hypothetical protein UU98_C0012G0041 [Parcubacteria group bacterium GW2011_GWD2_42_14]
MATKPVVNKAPSLFRKIIRTKEYATPFDRVLGINLVNIGAIQYGIRCLADMGESTREFDTYIAGLLLIQCDDLKRILKHTNDPGKTTTIHRLLDEAKEYLWPTKN